MAQGNVHLADQKAREAERADGGVSEAGIESMRADSRSDRSALLLIEELAQDLRPPHPSTNSGEARWQEFCRWTEDTIDSVATLTAFRQVTEDYFQRTEGHIGITG